MKNPFAAVKDQFGDKAKLVSAVEKFTSEDLWLGRVNADKGLKHVSNSKLLKLHATFTAVKEKFGTRFKLVDAITDLEKRTKDEGFRNRLLGYPVPRLWDMYKSAAKRGAAAHAGAPKKEAKTKAASAPKKKATEPAKKAAAKNVTKKA